MDTVLFGTFVLGYIFLFIYLFLGALLGMLSDLVGDNEISFVDYLDWIFVWPLKIFGFKRGN